MKKSITYFAIAASLLSCSAPDAASTLDQIESKMAQGQIEDARKLCDELAQADSILTSTQLMRLAIIYTEIAQNGDDLVDMAMAAQCYNHAFAVDPDSAAAYLSGIDSDQRMQLRILTDVSYAVSDDFVFDETDENDLEESL